MPNIGRTGDIFCGVCCCHCPACCIGMCGIVVTGSENVVVNGRLTARLTDVVVGFCGHIGIICSGSPNVKANGLPVSRVGDCTVGCLISTEVTGSPDVIVND